MSAATLSHGEDVIGDMAVVAGGLVIAAIPLLIGLAIMMPVLCHASWHLYRKLVPREHEPH